MVYMCMIEATYLMAALSPAGPPPTMHKSTSSVVLSIEDGSKASSILANLASRVVEKQEAERRARNDERIGCRSRARLTSIASPNSREAPTILYFEMIRYREVCVARTTIVVVFVVAVVRGRSVGEDENRWSAICTS